MSTTARVNPWYREPWPWILMAGPAAAVVAGAVTLALAIGSSDGLVAEDYYKQGLAVNQQLAREQKARALGVHGELVVATPAGGALRVELQGRIAAGEDLVLILSHPTRAGLDQRVRLTGAGNGVYAGRIDALAAGRWHAIVESAAGQWRVRGELQIPQRTAAPLS
jgi:hypothetical protein